MDAYVTATIIGIICLIIDIIIIEFADNRDYFVLGFFALFILAVNIIFVYLMIQTILNERI